MSARLRNLSHLFKSRLSRRIVFWVFASIVTIEAIILIPSVYRRQQELLTHLKEISAARASGTLGETQLSESDTELLAQLQQIQVDPVILGGALYTIRGDLIGSFGESPQLTFQEVTQHRQTNALTQNGSRYDAVWEMSPLEGRYLLIIRHDASLVQQDLVAFIGRITALVFVIGVFVTIANMIALEANLITPILMLRNDLLKAGEAIGRDESPPSFYAASVQRQDELGEVIAAFNQMYRQIDAAIAERKQAEAALRLSEQKFSTAFQSSPNPVTLGTFPEGRFIAVNDSFQRVFGYEAAEAIGRTAMELKLWDNFAARQDMIQVLRSQGAFRNREQQFRTKSGDRKIVLFSAELININGQAFLLTVSNDITQRKQAEEALRESEERFRTLIEQAADAVFVVDASSQILDVNQQACHNLGYTRTDLLQMTVPEINTQITLPQFQEIWQRLTLGISVTTEGAHRRKDGSIFPVEVRASLVESNGKQVLLALVRDISERKQTEQALAQLAEIGELAAMIVHEVRNPLTTVLMGLESFKRMELSERAQARLELALEESDRLQRLLNEILLYAKRQTLQLVELELNTLIHDLLEPLRSMPSARDRLIDFLPTSVPLQILGDRDKLKQVFINLISNACEAIAAGEAVTWQIEPDHSAKVVWIKIHNGGEPIPPELLPKLTQPFQTTKASGNGLGLAIARRIVEAHNGQLHIQSAATTGTIVSIYLPLLT